jgi:hypothetical protein
VKAKDKPKNIIALPVPGTSSSLTLRTPFGNLPL